MCLSLYTYLDVPSYALLVVFKFVWSDVDGYKKSSITGDAAYIFSVEKLLIFLFRLFFSFIVGFFLRRF